MICINETLSKFLSSGVTLLKIILDLVLETTDLI